MGERVRSIAILLALAASPSALLAGPAGFRRLPGLANESDAIIVGRPEQIVSLPSGASFAVSAIRVLKGPIMPGDRIQCLWDPAVATPAPKSSTVVGLWFLRAGENGVWLVLPPMTGDAPFPMSHLRVLEQVPAGPLAYSAGAEPFEKVISEIGSALQGSADRSQLVAFLSAGALDSPGSSAPPRMYAHIATSPIGALRALGLRALIKTGDVAALQRFAADTDALSEVGKQPFLATAVCDFRSTQPAAVIELSRIVQGDAPTALKLCAAHALRSVHTRDSLPALVSLLDADLSELRYEAVAGLASFANSLPVETGNNLPGMEHMKPTGRGSYTTDETLKHFPTVPTFAANEARYIGFWKAWWTVHQTEMGGAQPAGQ